MDTPTAELIEVRPGRILFHRSETLGSSTSPPKMQMLLLHGTCASSSQYNSLLQALSGILEESIICHRFDAISCGNSPLVQEWEAYHTDQAVLDLAAITEKEIDTSLPTVIIGHSYAPTTIIRFFHRHGIPSNMKGCIFLSSGISGPVNPIPDGGHPIFRLPVVILRCLQPSLTKSFLKLAYHPKTSQTLIEEASKSNHGNDMYMVKAYHRHHQWATNEECTALHGVPVLIIHGKDDKILPLEAGMHLADVVHATRIITVDEASHQVMEEKQVDVAQHIVTFIAENKLI